MPRRRQTRWYALVLVVLAASGGAYAAINEGDDGLGDLPKAVTLTPANTVKQAQEYAKKMGDTHRRVLGLADIAKKNRDVIKLNCVNDKLMQVKGHMKVAGDSMASLQTAVKANDDGARAHEYTRMTILFQKVTVLGTEAESCVGEDVSYIGPTKNDVEIDPSIPVTDPTVAPLPLPEVTRPPEASPFV